MMQNAPINSNQSQLSNSQSKFGNQIETDNKSKVEFL